MEARRVFRLVVVALLVAVQMPDGSQGLLRNQLTGLEERTVSGVRFWTPPDFVIERVTPAERTDSYVAMTFDARGRLAVSKENDFPRLLLDRDGDGIFEAESIVSEGVRNCQGLWFDGPVLHGACEMAGPSAPRAPGSQTVAAAGIFRMADTDGDDRVDTFETLGMSGRMQEHGPHAIRRTASGSWMVMMGNSETIVDQHLDLTSPVLHNVAGQFLPTLGTGASRRQGAHSALFEWHVPQRRFRVFSGGNRNSYDFAYNLAGEAFLFDSDHEPDIGLPWYRQVRTAPQIPNGDYGYRDTTGKYPSYYLDSLPPLREVGRGSPVGVETYQSSAYPREYFDNLLEADWSRGRIRYTSLTRSGATYTARPDPTELVHGEPLNVTDLEVGPDGMLYFATGGRLTQGGVWRLRYTGAKPAQPEQTGILAVVRQDQPLSSWGWAAIERVKTTMGEAAFGAALERLACNTGADAADRARALYELQRHGPAPNAQLLTDLAVDARPDVRAAVMFVVGSPANARIAAAGLKDADPLVRWRAAEALVRLGQSSDRPSLAPAGDIYAYALRVITTGWTSDQKQQLAAVLGRTSKWRGGLSYAAALGQVFEAFGGLYTTDAERAMLFAAAPDFAPFTAEEQAAIQSPAAAPGTAAGRGGRGGRGASPIQTRTQGRAIEKGEVFDEVIYTPRTQQADIPAGRAIFEASWASCHRAGGIGTDHGVRST